MSEEVNELLDKLGKLEDAPLIWVNKKVYDTSKEIERLKQELQDTKEHLGEYLYEQEEENKRLNNIINELEKYLNEQIQKSWEIEEQCYEDIESKLQELKGSDK